MTTIRRLLLALLTFVPASVGAQTMPWALEVPGGHALWQVDDVTLGAGPWTGIGAIPAPLEFLSVELPGYALADGLRADLPRLADALDPAPHVRLPVEGSLYRVRSAGSTHLLMVRTDGSLQSLFSAVDNGPEAAILPGLAVSRSGDHVLIATSLAAGGNALVIELTPTGNTIDLTLTLPPLTISATSMRLGSDTAWFLADGALYRATLGVPPPAGETAAVVPVTLAPGETLQEETVASGNGQVLAVLSEDALGDRTIHLAGATGPADALSAAPAAYDLPDYHSPVGPFVVLSEDGSQIAWRQTLLLKKEVFTRPTGLGGPLSQLTGDALFIDTIDNVGILGFQGNDVLLFAAGEANAGAIGSADFFRVDLGLGTEPVNITKTSGQSNAPFTAKGTLDVVGVMTDPTATALLVAIDPDNGDHGLLRLPIDGLSPGVEFMNGLLFAPQVIPAGSHVLLFSQPDLPSFPRRVHRLSATGQLTLLADVPDAAALVLDRFAVDRTGNQAAFVASAGPGLELPGLVDLATPSLSAAWLTILGVSPRVAFTPTGRLAAGVGFGGLGPYAWVGFTGFSTGVLYNLPVAGGFPLEP